MGDPQTVDASLNLILLGVIGMLLLAGAVILFFIVYQKRLFEQQDRIRGLETAYQKDLLASSIEAQEIERKRVATDLHDGIGSLLSAIRLYVLQLSPEKSPDEYEELLKETKSMVDTAIAQTREISHNLLPTTLDRFGVLQALEDLCKQLRRLNEIEVIFDYDQEYQFTKQQDLAIFRIFQELINNTLKHAEASKIHLSFLASPPMIQISYKDNGKGLDQEEASQKGAGLGLKSIESRVNLIQGEMQITTSKGNGFQFELQLPSLVSASKEVLD